MARKPVVTFRAVPKPKSYGVIRPQTPPTQPVQPSPSTKIEVDEYGFSDFTDLGYPARIQAHRRMYIEEGRGPLADLDKLLASWGYVPVPYQPLIPQGYDLGPFREKQRIISTNTRGRRRSKSKPTRRGKGKR